MKDKLIHYSRCGYNGDYTYTSVCGKKVRTHQEKETSSIYPESANCDDCIKTEVYKTDLFNKMNKSNDTIRRIYIESDILDAGEFCSAQRFVKMLANDKGLKCVDRVFSDVIDFAWHSLEKTWEAIKMADEIYASSSLMPIISNTYTGSPVIFDKMCENAIKESVTGKSVIILTNLKHIYWDWIDIDVAEKAFSNNNLFALSNDSWRIIEPVDFSSIKKCGK